MTDFDWDGHYARIAEPPTTKRYPTEETFDIYPGLCVDERRQGGAITFERTRIPVDCILGEWINGTGWDGVESGWELSGLGWTEAKFLDFIGDLLAANGEFGRLVMMLAEMGRLDRTSRAGTAWWPGRPKHRKRMIAQLRRCLVALGEPTCE